MIKTTAIRSVKEESMMVTWDIGRRCNFDCTYCESTRHDNHSSYTEYDELKNTFDFIKSWTAIYNSRRKIPVGTGINFTGGEPTINPNFWKLVSLIKEEGDNFNLSLTTNGSWGPEYSKRIVKEFFGVTISYHAEASQKFKDRVIKNILELSKTSIWLQVNIMLHVDYWDECVELCELLEKNNVKYQPRPIGDGGIERTGWFQDADGSQRRTSHTYTAEQKQWFWNKKGIEKKDTTASEGGSLGRSCCGGRCLQGKVDGEWQPVVLVDTEFKGWNCMVDWYFLHIDQATKLVYHHQTCQALHRNKRGALGSLDNVPLMIREVMDRLTSPQAIVCPNQRCGCGMCISKARDKEDFDVIWNEVTELQLN